MEAPESKNLRKLAASLVPDADEMERFVQALVGGKAASPALIWLEEPPKRRPFAALDPVSWQPSFVDRVSGDSRAGSHALHEAGAYYCLDLSSIFQINAARSIPFVPRTVLDVCASPGGKSVFVSRLWHPERLVVNEVIGKRAPALIANLKRCKVSADVVGTDVSRLSAAWPEIFDVVLVDAPCSGQSLIARGSRAPACFHPATINMNSNRQKRLVANAGKIVRPGGYLLYTTCTYSYEENEAIVGWIVKKFPEFVPVPAEGMDSYRSALTTFPCYRLWPQQNEGAGGFAALFRKAGEGEGGEIGYEAVTLYHRLRPSGFPDGPDSSKVEKE